MTRNEAKLGRNPRLGNVYRTWRRKDSEERRAILRQADRYRGSLDAL